MSKYECSKCKKMVQWGMIANMGTKKDPKWICKDCVYPKPLVQDIKIETIPVKHTLAVQEVKEDEGPLPLDGDSK
jgi:DNA-directed RNA polymerase subunit RPC12/RpoP